jgi:hypothetical protein
MQKDVEIEQTSLTIKFIVICDKFYFLTIFNYDFFQHDASVAPTCLICCSIE